METKLSPMQEYRENEALNAHTDNLVLMAEHVGDWRDQQLARKVVDSMSRYGYRHPEIDWIAEPLQAKLWPLFRNKFADRA
jgi:hypothetical protein